MDKQAIIKLCKQLGCCDACCLRYLGLKNPTAYENPREYVLKYLSDINTQEEISTPPLRDVKIEPNSGLATTHVPSTNGDTETINGTKYNDGYGEPSAKRARVAVCVSCVGILQRDTWGESCRMAKEELDKKGYECETMACALSSPIACLVRDARLAAVTGGGAGDTAIITPLKEAWKWSFGPQLATHVSKRLDSGAVCPLLVTLAYELPQEQQELEAVKALSPALFESRGRQKRRFNVEFTRRSVEQALDAISPSSLCSLPLLPPSSPARCVSVSCTHAPLYLAGRYIKMSRALPQTAWEVAGRRVLPGSVLETVLGPVASEYGMRPEEAESRFKMVCAGREDVDVRCLGGGRPFALEMSDPPRRLSPPELSRACAHISASGHVVVNSLTYVHRDDLARLKMGEQSKCKTYEALCIKLTHSKYDDCDPTGPVRVTQTDIDNINNFNDSTVMRTDHSHCCDAEKNTLTDTSIDNADKDTTHPDENTSHPDKNTSHPDKNTANPDKNTTHPDKSPRQLTISQKTPLRVLHRRPLLTRKRVVLGLTARAVPDHPQLFVLSIRTEAGTYIKEFVHGELGRTSPALGDALGADVDILALDVASVELEWPPAH